MALFAICSVIRIWRYSGVRSHTFIKPGRGFFLLFCAVFLLAALFPATGKAVATEKILFPMQTLKVTNTNHTGKIAMDFGGAFSSDGTHFEDVTAPFTGTIRYMETSYNAVWFESDNMVQFADGTVDYCTLLFLHDNDIGNLSVGMTVSQGAVFYQEGGMGPGGPQSYSTHLHVECMKGRVGAQGWNARGDLHACDVFYITKYTVIQNTGGFVWNNADGAAPSATLTAAQATYNSIRLTWAATAGAVKYELYRATSAYGSYKRLTTTAALNYTNKSVYTGTTYYYKVRSYRLVSGKKVYGPWSAVASAKTVLTAPAAPKAAALTYNSIKLTWGKVTGASRYEIWRATSPTGSYKPVAATSSASYTNKSLSTGTAYYYKIRAYRTVSGRKVYGPWSTTVSAKTILPAPTSVKAARASASSIRITWRKVTGTTKYEVWQAASAAGPYSLLTVTGSSSYTNKKLTAGKVTYYKVRAYRLVGGAKVCSAYSAVVKARP